MYLKADVLPDDPLTVRQRFWVAYNSASKLMVQWLGSLPEPERHIYQKFTLPPVSRLFVEGLTREKEVTQRQQRIRKAETDAVVPRFAAIRAEAHFRYNRIARLRQAYHQALRALSRKGQDFPCPFRKRKAGTGSWAFPLASDCGSESGTAAVLSRLMRMRIRAARWWPLAAVPHTSQMIPSFSWNSSEQSA